MKEIVEKLDAMFRKQGLLESLGVEEDSAEGVNYFFGIKRLEAVFKFQIHIREKESERYIALSAINMRNFQKTAIREETPYSTKFLIDTVLVAMTFALGCLFYGSITQGEE